MLRWSASPCSPELCTCTCNVQLTTVGPCLWQGPNQSAKSTSQPISSSLHATSWYINTHELLQSCCPSLIPHKTGATVMWREYVCTWTTLLPKTKTEAYSWYNATPMPTKHTHTLLVEPCASARPTFPSGCGPHPYPWHIPPQRLWHSTQQHRD